MKWPGRDSPGKGRFPAWHRADPSCQQDSGTITGSPALGPGGDPPRTPSAAGGRVVPQHLLTPTPLPRGHPSWGQATPLPPLPAQSVMQFLHKSTRRRKKQNDKRCPGPMPATWHSGNIGKVGPNGPSLPPNGRRRRLGTPGCPSAQRWSVRRAPLCVCTRTGTPPRPPPGTVRFCAVPALSLGKFTVLMLMVPGSSGLAGEAVTGRASGAHTASV